MRRAEQRSQAAAEELAPIEFHAMPGHLIRRMHQASQALFDREMAAADLDLTPVQYAALAVIDSRPGLDQSTLAAAIAFDRATTGGVIDRLEAKGLVRRSIDQGDRRARRLHLDPAGRQLLERVTPIVRRVQAGMLAGLSEAEQATLLRLIGKALAGVGDVTRLPTPLAELPAGGGQPASRRNPRRIVP